VVPLARPWQSIYRLVPVLVLLACYYRVCWFLPHRDRVSPPPHFTLSGAVVSWRYPTCYGGGPLRQNARLRYCWLHTVVRFFFQLRPVLKSFQAEARAISVQTCHCYICSNLPRTPAMVIPAPGGCRWCYAAHLPLSGWRAINRTASMRRNTELSPFTQQGGFSLLTR
jgi:hypothetical protein